MFSRLISLLATALLDAKAAAQSCSPTDCAYMDVCVPLSGRFCGPFQAVRERVVLQWEDGGSLVQVQICAVRMSSSWAGL
jgi:hypothetical protein